jgi:hypothetical protein
MRCCQQCSYPAGLEGGLHCSVFEAQNECSQHSSNTSSLFRSAVGTNRANRVVATWAAHCTGNLNRASYVG